MATQHHFEFGASTSRARTAIGSTRVRARLAYLRWLAFRSTVTILDLVLNDLPCTVMFLGSIWC